MARVTENNSSVNYDIVKGFMSYILTQRDDLTIESFTDFNAANFAIGIEGVKGKQILPKLWVGQLSKRWTRAFTPDADTLKFGYDMIETHKAKVELIIYPQDFESSAITGRWSPKGQKTAVIPQEERMFSQVKARLKQEIGDAFWNGKETATPLVTDDLDQLFNGQRELFKAKGAAGQINVVPIPTGNYTASNVAQHLKAMRNTGMGKAYKNDPNNAYIASPSVVSTYEDLILTPGLSYKLVTETVNGVKRIRDIFNSSWIYEMPELEGTDFCAYLNPNRMFYAFDAFSDTNTFDCLPVPRGMSFWMDYMFGVQCVTPKPEAIVWNGKA